MEISDTNAIKILSYCLLCRPLFGQGKKFDLVN